MQNDHRRRRSTFANSPTECRIKAFCGCGICPFWEFCERSEKGNKYDWDENGNMIGNCSDLFE
jgi:hypothetical protein